MRAGPKMAVPRIAAGMSSLMLLLAACGGGGGGGGSPPPAPPPADTTPPSVPQSLTATVLSASRIDLSWSASTDAGTGVAGYRVFRDAGATAIATSTESRRRRLIRRSLSAS